MHHLFSFWSNRSFAVKIILSNHCSKEQWPAPTSSSTLLVKGYPTLFCTIGKHDWPQLGLLQPILMTGTNWWQGLWEQLSSFSPYYSHQPGHHWMNWRAFGIGFCRVECTVCVWKRRWGLEYFFCANASVRVCVCICVWVSVESRPGLICSHRCARSAGVPVPRRLRAASFSQENAFNRSWVTAKQHRHLRDARNVPPHQRPAFGHFYICN